LAQGVLAQVLRSLAREGALRPHPFLVLRAPPCSQHSSLPEFPLALWRRRSHGCGLLLLELPQEHHWVLPGMLWS